MSHPILWFIALLLSYSVLRADCDGEGWEMFPDGATLSPQPVLVLDGHFRSTMTIDSIRAGTPIYLRSKKHTVQLRETAYFL
jgi:hypothetical protein